MKNGIVSYLACATERGGPVVKVLAVVLAFAYAWIEFEDIV